MNTNYSLGLHEIGNDCYAYLQPDGGWGYSNAGLVVGNGGVRNEATRAALSQSHLVSDSI